MMMMMVMMVMMLRFFVGNSDNEIEASKRRFLFENVLENLDTFSGYRPSNRGTQVFVNRKETTEGHRLLQGS